MIRLLLFGFIVTALLAGLPSDTTAQAKKNAKAIVATDEQYALLSKYPEMVGVIQGTTPGMITLRVEYDHAKTGAAAKNNPANGPTAAQQQQMARLQQEMQNVGRIANPQQRQQKMATIQAQMAQLQQQVANSAAKGQNPSALVKDFIDYDLPLTDNVVIRKSKAGVEYDEKGNIKEAVVEKGQKGFAAKFEDLTKGDEVRVYFAKAETAKTVAPKKDENGAIVSPPANRPRVNRIMIVKDVDGPATPDRKKKN